MHKIRVAGAVVFCALAVVIGVKVFSPSTLPLRESAAVEPKTIELNGVIYDFSRSHPDFAAAPAGGFGHYAGSVGTKLPRTRRPALATGGFKVISEWEDSEGRPIAPHIAGVRDGLERSTLGIRVDDEIELRKRATVDAFNSNYGPYGSLGNYGRDAVIATNSTAHRAVRLDDRSFVRGDILVGPGGSPSNVIESKGYITGRRTAMDEAFAMPQPSLPDHLQPYQDKLELDGDVTLVGDTTPDDGSDEPALHCGELKVRHDAIVRVDGELVIRCDRKLEIDKSQVVLLPGATLSIFVSDVGGGGGDVKIRDRSIVNGDPGDTGRVTITALGSGKLEIDKSHVYATIVAPERELRIKHEGHFYGSFVGQSLEVEDRCGLHVDLGNARPGPRNFALSVREKVKVQERSTIDSFDSNDGPYGGTNIGSNAWVSTNAINDSEKVELKDESVIRGDLSIGPFGRLSKVVKIDDDCYVTGTVGKLANPQAIPLATSPAIGPTVGDVEYKGGEHRIDADLRCKKLKLEDGAVLNISGDVVIRVDDKIEMKDGSEIQLDPGATLALHVRKEIKLEEQSKINTRTGNPQIVSIGMMSLGDKGKIELKGASMACAWVQGVRAEMKVEDGSEFFGSFAGQKVEVKKDSWFHVDMAYLDHCVDPIDTAGAAGGSGTGGISSETTFDQWFRAVMGVNQSIGHAVTLTQDGRGVYRYVDEEFYPVDGRLIGNEGEPHNHHFTYAIWARFAYEECAGQFIEFEGGDGAWVFVDDTLVLDLGGMRTDTEQYIDIDRLGLEAGRIYSVRLFYAQRRAGDSVFRLRTNIELMADKTIPNISAQFD